MAAEEEKIQIVLTYKSTQRTFQGYYSCRQWAISQKLKNRDQEMSRGKHKDWNCDKRHPSAIKKMTCYNVFIGAISDFPSDGSYRRTQHLSNLLDFSLDIRRLRHLKNPHMLCWSKLLWDLRNRAICLRLALWHMLNLISELKRNQTGINKKKNKNCKKYWNLSRGRR